MSTTAAMAKLRSWRLVRGRPRNASAMKAKARL